MGDRANVCIIGDDHRNKETGAIFLYTHWAGSELDETVHAVIARRQRWGDTPYLRRMIFCAMVAGCEKEETGYGISSTLCDNSHPIIVVNDKTQTVGLAAEDAPTKPVHKISYEEFIADVASLKYHRYDSHGKEEPEDTDEG